MTLTVNEWKISIVMGKIFNWIKTHKLLTFNIIVVALILRAVFGSRLMGSSLVTGGSKAISVGGGEMNSIAYDQGMTPLSARVSPNPLGGYEAAPTPNIADRKVVVNSNFSLLVKSVQDTVEKIKVKTLGLQGYTVTYNITNGEYGDSATVQLRVPSENVDEMSKYLRSLAVKVVSERIDGSDITDQYVDIERRMADLEKQKTKMQTIMDNATTVEEMMRVQPYLNQIQDQLDRYKGQVIYMDGVTKTSKLTVSISTDELSLPYAPKQPWRPEAIFKNAVRSMLGTLQIIAGAVIWMVVYSPVAIVAVLFYKLVRRIFRKKVQ